MRRITADEAKQKLCPFIKMRADYQPAQSALKDTGAAENIMCVADGCMAWRIEPGMEYEQLGCCERLES